jgi:hypothetical protein
MGYILKDSHKWEINIKVECPKCPVTGVRVLAANGLWAGTRQRSYMGPEYEGYWNVEGQKLEFPLKVRLVSGSGSVGEEIEETIQELVNDKLIPATKEFKRCNEVTSPGEAPAPAFDCTLGVCVTPATILDSLYHPAPGGSQSILSESACREACTQVDGCTHSSYCPPSDPACVLATDDLNEALIGSNHVRRCILYAGCTSSTLRTLSSNFGDDIVPYVTCPRDTHFQMVDAGCTDTLDPACASR